MDGKKWFYIKHIITGKVISIANKEECPELLRSQVVVTKPKFTDSELWCWDEQRLRNKNSGLVLDIRKGKLRIIEDTEICLYHKKPDGSAQNQLWATRQAETYQTEHPLAQTTIKGPFGGMIIHSYCSSDWVLDIGIDNKKLIVLPLHYDAIGGYSNTQLWSFIPENEIENPSISTLIFDKNKEVEQNEINTGIEFIYYHNSSISSISTLESSNSGNTFEFPHSLSPSKRSSTTSLASSSRKGSASSVTAKTL